MKGMKHGCPNEKIQRKVFFIFYFFQSNDTFFTIVPPVAQRIYYHVDFSLPSGNNIWENQMLQSFGCIKKSVKFMSGSTYRRLKVIDFHIYDLRYISCRRLHIPVCGSKFGTSAVGCVLKVSLKCSSRGGKSVEGVVIVTVGYKSIIAPTCSGLLN